jgi:hypothetical protein
MGSCAAVAHELIHLLATEEIHMKAELLPADSNDVDPNDADPNDLEASDLEPDPAELEEASDLDFADMPCTDDIDGDDSPWEAFIPDEDEADPEPDPGDFWIETESRAEGREPESLRPIINR